MEEQIHRRHTVVSCLESGRQIRLVRGSGLYAIPAFCIFPGARWIRAKERSHDG